jgi:lauroyl/myristoyl acyltransferase
MSSPRSATRWTLYRFSTKSIFRGIVLGTRLFPMWLLRWIVKGIGVGFWPFMGRLKRAVDANMAIIFPEASPRDLRRLTKLTFNQYLLSVAEFWHNAARYDPRIVEEYGEDVKALKKGGNILLSAHVGNWELGAFYLKHIGVPFVEIGQPEEDPYVERQRQIARGRFGIQTLLIDDKEGILFKVRERLEKGDNIILLAERAFAKDFVPVKLFETDAAFLKTPFLLSRWLKVPIQPMFFMKEPTGKYRGYLGRPILPAEASEMAREYAGELEGILRRFPTQWYNFFPYAEHCRRILS